ncbi:hypothetical protein [Methylobacterium komagatae]
MANRVLGEVAGRQVVATGTILISANQEATIFPFEDDPSYGINIQVDFSEIEKPVVKSRDINGTPTIIICRNFETGAFAASKNGLNFADDAELEYYIRITGFIVGIETRYTVTINYNVLQEKKRNV